MRQYYDTNCDDMVLALSAAPVDPRTGNVVVYGASWLADRPSMIGNVNENWRDREIDWFLRGSDRLSDMSPPVPKLFADCADDDGKVNSAYGHILFSRKDSGGMTAHQRVLHKLMNDLSTRQATAVISDRDIHVMATANGMHDFICTNALSVMVDAGNRLHIFAQMRSMDAVFGYRADYSMWEVWRRRLVNYLRTTNNGAEVTEGDIVFQVANLHVYPRHLTALQNAAADTQERLDRRVWQRMNRKAD